jgi:hypothetical protein
MGFLNERYRDKKRFLDLCAPSQLERTHSPLSSFIRVSPELLAQIEADAQKHCPELCPIHASLKASRRVQSVIKISSLRT